MLGKRGVFAGALIASLVVLLAGVWTAGSARPHGLASGGAAKPEERNWRVLPGVTCENLTVFPVVAGSGADTGGFATLDEALASGDALVTEEGAYLRRSRDGSPEPSVYSGPQVNQLVLVNRGKRPLLLLAGEVVSGGKQDRIIGKDRIVPVGGAPLPLDVFCVEHGRWTGGSDQFAEAKTMVHPTVREQAAVEQDQTKVWAAVGGAAKPIGNSSQSVEVRAAPPALAPAISADSLSQMVDAAPTKSYRKIYQSPKVETSVEEFAREIEQRFNRATSGLKDEHIIGVVVAYGGEPVWSDVFASRDLFETYWPKLLRSYIVEALTRPRTSEKVSADDARDFLTFPQIKEPPNNEVVDWAGNFREEGVPGVYLWREQWVGNRTQIRLDALGPRQATLHWLVVLRSN